MVVVEDFLDTKRYVTILRAHEVEGRGKLTILCAACQVYKAAQLQVDKAAQLHYNPELAVAASRSRSLHVESNDKINADLAQSIVSSPRPSSS